MRGRHVTRVTRGHQITIPKAVRGRTGLEIGDIVEVDVEEGGVITVRRFLPAESPILEWGREFAKQHHIQPRDIVNEVRAVRRQLFHEEYG